MATLAAPYGRDFAPISRFPPEILIEIFSYNTSVITDFDANVQWGTALDRLANVGLLTLSQVCSRWHSLVLDTPALWSLLYLNGVLWRTRRSLLKTIPLLSAALARSQNAPLSVKIFESDWKTGRKFNTMTTQHSVFQLLAQHSHRWRKANFIFAESPLDMDLSCLKGKLPLLQSLALINRTVSPCSHTGDFLVGAPLLKSLSFFMGPGAYDATVVPVQQLTDLTCWVMKATDITSIFTLASKLPRDARLVLGLVYRRNPWPAYTTQPTPLYRLAISRLKILSHCADPHMRKVSLPLAQIFESIMLPSLKKLELTYNRPLFLQWPHEQFLQLCERSAFPRCLKVLCIANLHIPERELIQVLSALHALEHLEISYSDKRANQYKLSSTDSSVTDNVLRALTSPAPRPIPRLRYFACDSFWLQCSCDAFVDFVKSRLEESAPSVFRIQVWSAPDGDEGLSCAVPFHSRLQEMAADSNGALLYNFTRVEPDA
ncbi:hypothetical protein GGX14DRAFT_699861 [Mycena pura]|uniref:F-box domain-containing protein n=1 Tax=Mycena pura TaxID=153505 RepID=A0AAD6V0L6_9AGAR|nr:hypothetical protein GGX14DRAFT_699861 [Mycena pura]